MTNINILVIVISIISLCVIGIPILFGLLLPTLKPKISKTTSKYLYAFSSGFFLIMATVLFIGESKTHLQEHFKQVIHNDVGAKAITGALIAGIVLGGLLISLGVKYLFGRNHGHKNHQQENHEHHDHDDIVFNINDYNPKSKAFAIFFLLSHRLPDGLIIGLLCSQIAREGISPTNIIFLVSFIIHVIPEELIIYYRQIEMGITRKKAMLNSLIATTIIIPLIIVGAIIGWFSLENELAIHIVQLIAASFLLFISIIEFVPEFLHDIKDNGKNWYITILIFIVGIAIGLFVLCFHDHEINNHIQNASILN